MALFSLSTSGATSPRRCSEFYGFCRPMRNGFLTVLLAFGFFFPICANAQLVKQSDTLNPLNSGILQIGTNDGYSSPAFVDIDGDGDFDAFVGFLSGLISFYQNMDIEDGGTGPRFIKKTGADNPLDSISQGDEVNPYFVKLDGDLDFDVFIGNYDGTLLYYENTGTVNAANFIPSNGTSIINPFEGMNIGSALKPAFVDIDNDGDLDAFFGILDGSNIKFFRNNGSNSFSELTEAANPLNSVNVGFDAAPAFVKFYGDTVYDVVVGGRFDLQTYKNTGSQAVPNFVQESVDPALTVDTGSGFNPFFVDIDGDSVMEAFIGRSNGQIDFYDDATAPGDINGDGSIMLDDTILGLQIVAGMDTAGANITPDAEVNGDDPAQIGLEEIIFTLRDVAGLNQ